MSGCWAFSGDRAHCTKCGHDEAHYLYQPGSLDWERGDPGSRPDCMVRRCKRCGYQWFEQCADSTASAPEKTPIQETA